MDVRKFRKFQCISVPLTVNRNQTVLLEAEVAELLRYSEISGINGISGNNPEITKRNQNSGPKPKNYKKKQKFRKFPSKFLHMHDVSHTYTRRRLYERTSFILRTKFTYFHRNFRGFDRNFRFFSEFPGYFR